MEIGFFYLDWVLVGWSIFALIVIIAAGKGILHFLRSGYAIPMSFKKRILRVRLPKEASSDSRDDKAQRETMDRIREKIGLMETLFSAIGGLRAQRGLKAWLFGREDHLAFEIVADQGIISFFVAVPQYLYDFVQQQVQAQFPEAQIDEEPDYNVFAAKGVVIAANVVFKRAFFYPLKTYQYLDADPMDAITNSLSKIDVSEGAAIQYVVRSAKGVWHRWGAKVAQEMKQGKSVDDAVREVAMGSIMKSLRALFGVTWRKKKDPSTSSGQAEKRPKTLSAMEEEMIKGFEEKTSKHGMDVNLRVVTSAATEERAEAIMFNVINSFSHFNHVEYGNSLKNRRKTSGWKGYVYRHWIEPRVIRDFIYRNYNEKDHLLLNSEEMASVYHFPLTTTDTPNIDWLLAKRAPAPVNVPKEGLVMGYNIYRGVETVIRIKDSDRRRHMYIIGRSGSGKSVLMENMAKQDIEAGRGVCVLDPHGEFVEYILEHIPKERAEDVVLFNPSDMERPVGLNMLEAKSEDQKDFAVQEMISIFYKLFPPEMIGPMFEHHMRNVMLTLMSDIQNPGTITDIPRMFSDEDFSKSWVKKLKDPVVRAYWEKEVAKTSDFHKSETLGYLISKVGRFVENEMMRNIMGQNKSGFDFREIMDKKKILLVNLSKGKTGEVNSQLLGMIIVSKLQMAAMGRADMAEKDRHDFYMYIDEFQNFVTNSISTILSEARKYKLNLIIAHQYVGQLVKDNDTAIRDAVFGNAGTMFSFRIGVDDAEVLQKEFDPVFNAYDLLNVEKYSAYVKLLVDNEAAKPFNMTTYPPIKGDAQRGAMIRELARMKYGRDRRIVEAEILERSQLGMPMKQAANLPPEASR